MTGKAKYDVVYGDTFNLYNKKDMLEFIHPLEVRFKRNKLDPKKTFKDKNCFDAGCGNGRGTLFMLKHGAKKVTANDFSPKNIESTRRFAQEFGYSDRVTFQQGTLEKIPYPDQSFDVVWCNGVLMHTKKPNVCFSEISRVLKIGGRSWIYVYGAGGIYWRIIFFFRDWLKNINTEECIQTLKLLRYSTRYVAEFIDDWFVEYLRVYTNKSITASLRALGFENPQLLKYGTDYDTSHRRSTFSNPQEAEFMGEGDLRYLLVKNQHTLSSESSISRDQEGSQYDYPALITENLDPLLKAIRKEVRNRNWLKIAAAAKIQRELRLLLTKPEKIDFTEVKTLLQDVYQEVIKIKSF